MNLISPFKMARIGNKMEGEIDNINFCPMSSYFITGKEV
jgi:hypothetical protein